MSRSDPRKPTRRSEAIELAPEQVLSPAAGSGRAGGAGVIVACGEPPLPYHLAFGARALGQAVRLQRSTITAWIVPEDSLDALQTADTPEATWTQLAIAVGVLRAAGVPSVAIAHLLQLHAADITRLARLNKACEKLKHLVGVGKLSAGHARQIATFPHAEQIAWCEWCLARKASVRQLEIAISDARRGKVEREAPDLGPFLRQLSEALGTEVHLENGELRLAFYSADEAKGLMTRLAAGPSGACPPSTTPSWLRIPVLNNDDLHELTGHLVQL